MNEAYFFTDIDGEFRYMDEQVERMESYIEMLRGHITILKTCTLRKTEKELERLIERKEAYIKGKMKELSGK